MNLHVTVDEFADGSVCLSCGEGMEADLVFASGAMRGDPVLDAQREILNEIAKRVNSFGELTTKTI